MTRTALYRHFDRAGRLLYVGISLDALRRLGQHKQHAHWFTAICRVDIEFFDTRQKALDAEREAIRTERPLHNVALRSGGSVDFFKPVAWGVLHPASGRLDGWYFNEDDGIEMLAFFASEYPRESFRLVVRRECDSPVTGLKPLRTFDAHMWALEK